MMMTTPNTYGWKERRIHSAVATAPATTAAAAEITADQKLRMNCRAPHHKKNDVDFF